MNCEQSHCIYNRDFFCILKKVQIGSSGLCEDCIIVSIPEESLKIMKEMQLAELEEKYKKDGFKL